MGSNLNSRWENEMTQCLDPIGCSHDGFCGCPNVIQSPGFNPDLSPAQEAFYKNCWVPEGLRDTPAGNKAVYDYEVKSWPWFFEPMCAGNKKHDMRDKRERPYKIGDRMLLREWDPRTGQYTGREAVATITYITSNDSPCAMSSNALDRDAAILSVLVSELGYTDRNA